MPNHPIGKLLIVLFALHASAVFGQEGGQTPPGGPAQDSPRGFGAEMRADRDVFHYLLERRAEIRRTVTRLENGVETLTESENPEVAAKLREHVASMHKRLQEGRGLRWWDDLFAEIFRHSKQIEMHVEPTRQGVRVRETSSNPSVVLLIQAHAEVVSKFVEKGFAEAHENHPVPQTSAAPPALAFPTIEKYGGVAPLPTAKEQPRAGAKAVLDITTAAKPGELNKGLERAARLLNLYGAAGLKPSDVRLSVVLHGEATKAVLTDRASAARYEIAANPNLPLIAELRKVGVEVLVCGQALHHQGFAAAEVAEEVSVAASALSALINKQTAGYAYIPIP